MMLMKTTFSFGLECMYALYVYMYFMGSMYVCIVWMCCMYVCMYRAICVVPFKSQRNPKGLAIIVTTFITMKDHNHQPEHNFHLSSSSSSSTHCSCNHCHHHCYCIVVALICSSSFCHCLHQPYCNHHTCCAVVTIVEISVMYTYEGDCLNQCFPTWMPKGAMNLL